VAPTDKHQAGDDAAPQVPGATRKESNVSKPQQPLEYVDMDRYGADEQWAILVRALAVVVGSAETKDNLAEITAWSKESIENVARQCFEFRQSRLRGDD
jgi:hypothetical protein